MVDREGVPEAKITVVQNGYDWASSTPDDAGVDAWRERFPGRRLLVCVGRLDPVKDLPTTFRAVATVARTHPDVTLVVAGTGTLAQREAAEGQARRAGISERTHFAGHVEPIFDLLGAADVFLQASIDEACPQTISEAAGLGVPMAVTTTGGTPEIVGAGHPSVPAGDAVALAGRVERLLTDPVAARAEAAARATRVRDELTIERQMEQLAALYRRVSTPRPTPDAP
jgi:glycosyltransferase involved in cell wall biosynthesis